MKNNFLKKSLSRRIFFLKRAEERAQNPDMKKLWETKKDQLMKVYLEQK
tara:strand:- start:250 stop:396 length:147 start_codon:yes stop_codon:yes gene_type:complete